jgi:predicted DNA-binding protein with PD1-like motif
MRVEKCQQGFFVRLDPGEEVMQCLTRMVQEHGLQGGMITGIGAVKDPIVGYFDLHTKEYFRRTLAGDHELVGLSGNITWVEGKQFIHAHVILAGPDLACHGGHLFSAEIAVTGEFFVLEESVVLRRVPDQRSGLNLIGD